MIERFIVCLTSVITISCSCCGNENGIIFKDDFKGENVNLWDCFDAVSGFADGQFLFKDEHLKIIGPNDSGLKVCANGEDEWNEYTLEATVTNMGGVDAHNAGIIFKMDAVNENAYIFNLVEREQKIEIVEKNITELQAGRVLASKTYPVELGIAYVLRVEMRGDNILAFIDDIEEFSVTDSQLTSGKIGLCVGESVAIFDDVVVTESN